MEQKSNMTEADVYSMLDSMSPSELRELDGDDIFPYDVVDPEDDAFTRDSHRLYRRARHEAILLQRYGGPQYEHIHIPKPSLTRQQAEAARWKPSVPSRETIQSSLTQLELIYNNVPSCVDPTYRYHDGDVLDLIPPSIPSKEGAQYQKQEEQWACQLLGRTYIERPLIATDTGSGADPGITTQQKQHLIETWNQQGWGLSIAPLDYPRLACWRTRPCVGLLLLRDPTCPVAVAEAVAEQTKNQQQIQQYNAQRKQYLDMIQQTQGVDALQQVLQLEGHSPQQFHQQCIAYHQQQQQRQPQETAHSSTHNSTPAPVT